MRLHIRDCLLPIQERGGTARALECRPEVDPGFGSGAVAANAVLFDEGLHSFLERHLGVSLESCEVRTTFLWFRQAGRNERPDKYRAQQTQRLQKATVLGIDPWETTHTRR